jgi:hypothetical protein
VGFRHTIPAFDRTKTIHALHRAATVFSLMVTSKVEMYVINYFHLLKMEATKHYKASSLVFLFIYYSVDESEAKCEGIVFLDNRIINNHYLLLQRLISTYKVIFQSYQENL